MSTTAVSKTIAAEIAYYLEPIALDTLLPINVGLSSATEATMISILGPPFVPLSTTDQPSKASPLVTKLKETRHVSAHVAVTGIKPALDSLADALKEVFEQETKTGHGLESVLSTDGMLVVRLRNPTSGIPSKKISNHSWGTAIDFKIIGHSSPGNTGHSVPRFIAVMLNAFNRHGWFSGIAFHDSMHFEVADQTIRTWSAEGKFKTTN